MMDASDDFAPSDQKLSSFEGLRFTSSDAKEISTESARHRFDINQTKFDHRNNEDVPWIDTSMSWINLADLHNAQGNIKQALVCIEIARCFSELGEQCKNAARELKKATGMAAYDLCNAIERNKSVRAFAGEVSDSLDASHKNIHRAMMDFGKYAHDHGQAIYNTAQALNNVLGACITSAEQRHAIWHAVKDKAATMRQEDWVRLVTSVAMAPIRDPGMIATGMIGMPTMQVSGCLKGILGAVKLQAMNAGRYAINEK